MNAALEFELLKARRAGVFRWGALVVAVGVPALCTAFFELVRLGGDSPSAAKAATMITDLSLAGLLAASGQVLSVAILMTVGIAASWSFGREFVDDALPALLPSRHPAHQSPPRSSSSWPCGRSSLSFRRSSSP